MSDRGWGETIGRREEPVPIWVSNPTLLGMGVLWPDLLIFKRSLNYTF